MMPVSHEPPAEVKRETLAEKNRRMDAEWELLRELDRAERRIIELQAEVEVNTAKPATYMDGVEDGAKLEAVMQAARRLQMDADLKTLRAENDRLRAEVETLKARNAALHIRLHRAYAAQRDTEPMP